MPTVPAPDDLRAFKDIARPLPSMSGGAERKPSSPRAIEIRPVPASALGTLADGGLPVQCAWFRAAGPVPDGPALHRSLLAYASDFALLSTAILPHGVGYFTPGMVMASLDHALWFYEDFRIDDWLLYAMDSPVAGNARGLARGNIFRRDGTLVACVAQEGLIRMTKPG